MENFFPEKLNNNHFMNNIKVNLAVSLPVYIHMLSLYDIQDVDALKYTVNNRLCP